MPTGSFPIAPTALSEPLRSYGMLAYHAVESADSTASETSARGLSPVELSVQGRLTSELLRFL